MEGNYEVRFGNRIVGTVKAERRGLYYQFSCRCSLSGDVICRLKVRCGEMEQDLGILVPMEGTFGLEKMLPAKYLGQGIPEFTLGAKGESASRLCSPVYPEEPFAYIEQLKDAFLVRSEDRVGLCIKEPGR